MLNCLEVYESFDCNNILDALLVHCEKTQANLQQGRFADQGQFSERFLARLRHSTGIFIPSPAAATMQNPASLKSKVKVYTRMPWERIWYIKSVYCIYIYTEYTGCRV